MAQLMLSLQASDTATPGQAAWFLDGTAAADPFVPQGPPPAELGRLFLESFEQGGWRSLVDDQVLRNLRGRSFGRDFATVQPALGPRLPALERHPDEGELVLNFAVMG